MHRNYKNILILRLALLLFSYSSFLSGQASSYPLEKIYSHTDRPFYFPGESIWFKSYVVNEENKPSNVSDVLIAELISPKGSVVETKNLSLSHGHSFGDFTIQEDWVGGIYSLRMYTNYMKNYGKASYFTKKITVQKIIVPKLLLTLDFQREAYGKGSEVNVDFKVEDLKNNLLKTKEYKAQVLLKGSPYLEQTFQTDEVGESIIKFKLPVALNTSDIVLNVQVPHQGTTESISRTVPVLMDNIDLQFLPEAGKTILGTSNTVAFKALNEFGKPADVSGVVVDVDGKEIKRFQSFHDGMGAVELKPKDNRSYFAKITSPFKSDSLYPLPKIHSEGAKISLKENKSNQTKWSVYSTLQFEGFFQAHSASNQILFEEAFNFEQGSVDFLVNTSKFSRGITKFRLLDRQKNILSERLVFVNKDKGLNIKLKLNKKEFAPREKVIVEIETKDSDNNPISSNLSLAVTDNALLSFADDKQDRIDSYLLMSSELNGKIHKPSFYFDPKEDKAIKAMDLVMLTHGWRDYLINPIDSLDFLPEKRNLVKGQILDRKGNPKPANLFLFDKDGNKALQFKTNQNGQFQFKLGEKSSYVLVAYREDKQPLKIVEEYIKNKNSRSNENGQAQSAGERKESNFFKSDKVEKPLQEPILEKASFSTSLVEDAQSLDEVVIIGYGSNMTKNALGFAQTTVYTNELDGISGTVNQLLQGRVAGVEITNAGGASGTGTLVTIRGISSIRGANQPLYVIDGIPYSNGFLGDQGAELKNLNPSQIESINVLKGVAASSLFGASGANGVVIISTKKGNYRYDDKVLARKKFNNYSVKQLYKNSNLPPIATPKKFYMPVYDGFEAEMERTDFRKTIYWNPVVQTNKQGKAKLEFYNSDAITSFKVTAEGIAYNGLIDHAESVYSIQRPLSVTTKLPNYSSLNDTINIPLTISNNTSKAFKIKLDIDVPKNFNHLNKDVLKDSILVEANSFALKDITLVPITVGQNLTFTASIKGSHYSDAFSKEMTVLSPYFPVETSISGSKNGKYSFEITNLVANSASADFKIYMDVVGDVMNGIEGMIKQPYGCFEQTSSATYPNVMILKYLKEAGKTNVEVEVKAMDFIKQGYKRLVSFETSKGGFEWFGHTPPHETLTAFGILEFTEMKEVYSGVDEKMIDRTVHWLLNQKDGEGGFHKSKKGYDSFASSPQNVANAYIVYALSEVGLKSEIKKEYQSSLEEALKSEDTYRMALMALASKNIGDESAYQTLVDKLLSQINRVGFGKLPVENTITRSYGKSKELETTAFVVLALLRQNQYAAEIAEGIQFLTSNRENGRFGSTQATVMSLKALIEYTKTQKQKIVESGNSLELTINGNTIARDLLKSENGLLKIDGIGQFLSEGQQVIEVIYNNSEETFPYSLDVQWNSHLPRSSKKTPIKMETIIKESRVSIGSLARMNIVVSNTIEKPVSMTTAIIGIPSGTSLQPYQLKELLEKQQFDYFEVFDNYLVLYWKSLEATEKKVINLDLKAEIAGTYKAPASAVYLYYGNENKHWIGGTQISIDN